MPVSFDFEWNVEAIFVEPCSRLKYCLDEVCFRLQEKHIKNPNMYKSWENFAGKPARSYVNIHQQDYNLALFIFNGKN